MVVRNQIHVGLVQVNNSFANQNYLPYSLGILQAYAQKYLNDPQQFKVLIPLYSRIPVQKAVAHLREAQIVFFSTYVWNMRISLSIAESLKKLNPKVIIVFGGPQVPDRDMDFLKKYPFIDLTIHGEGEIPFLRILEAFERKDWLNVPSLRYTNEAGKIIETPRCERIKDLDSIPSPFLTGVFEPLMKANPQEEWLGSWETNRGCPFSCAFCDWGSATQSKVNKFAIDRLFKEMDWFSDNKIKFIFCCDANFGILPRDVEIAQYAADKKRATGYPEALSVQNTKNSTENSYTIQKILGAVGLNKGVTLAVQSMSPEALEGIKRKNIKLSVFKELQQRFANDKVETYSDFILGLPGETYTSFKDGVSQLIENGQHHRIQFNNLSILPNAEINYPEYRQKHGLITQFSKSINMHGSLAQAEEVDEMQELVVGTKTMPKPDWVKVRAFAWMTALLHFDKVMQIPLILIHQNCGVSYRELLEIFAERDIQSPVIKEIRQFFMDKAVHMQNGGEDNCESKEWLNIWWPADELMFIELCVSKKIDLFYEEAKVEFKRFLKEKGLDFPGDIIDEAVYLNRELLKVPFQHEDKVLQVNYNIFEAYRAVILGDAIPLQKGQCRYRVDRSSKTWDSWEQWCKEVVWYGNKKGAYLYMPLNIDQAALEGALGPGVAALKGAA